jgi:hypothetical protein
MDVQESGLRESKQRWRSAVAGVLAKSTRRDPADLPPEPERLLDSPTYEGFPIRALYTSLDALPEPPLPGDWPFVRGGDGLRDVKSGWKVAEAFPVAGQKAVTDGNGANAALGLLYGIAGRYGDALAFAEQRLADLRIGDRRPQDFEGHVELQLGIKADDAAKKIKDVAEVVKDSQVAGHAATQGGIGGVPYRFAVVDLLMFKFLGTVGGAEVTAETVGGFLSWAMYRPKAAAILLDNLSGIAEQTPRAISAMAKLYNQYKADQPPPPPPIGSQ